MSKRSWRDKNPEFGPPLLSLHGAVLAQIARDRDATVEAMARHLHVTPRTVRRVITDLESAEILRRVRTGNRNAYALLMDSEVDAPLKKPTVGEFINRLK